METQGTSKWTLLDFWYSSSLDDGKNCRGYSGPLPILELLNLSAFILTNYRVKHQISMHWMIIDIDEKMAVRSLEVLIFVLMPSKPNGKWSNVHWMQEDKSYVFWFLLTTERPICRQKPLTRGTHVLRSLVRFTFFSLKHLVSFARVSNLLSFLFLSAMFLGFYSGLLF